MDSVTGLYNNILIFSLIKAAHFYICNQLVDDICPNNKIKYKLQY